MNLNISSQENPMEYNMTVTILELSAAEFDALFGGL